MIDKKYIELMNRDLDNLITEEGKISLHNYLAGNEEAMEYYQGLLSVNEYLNHNPDPVPAENLKNRILNSINFNKYTKKSKSRDFYNLRWFFNTKFVITFAAGLLAGIFIYSIFTLNSGSISMNDLSGTIGNSDNAVILEQIPLNLPGVIGSIEIKEQDQNLFFNITSNSPRATDFIITYPKQIQLENIKPGSQNNFKFFKGQDFIKMTITGTQQFSVMFTVNEQVISPAEIKILQSGNRVYEREIPLKR